MAFNGMIYHYQQPVDDHDALCFEAKPREQHWRILGFSARAIARLRARRHVLKPQQQTQGATTGGHHGAMKVERNGHTEL